jgi:glucokinase
VDIIGLDLGGTKCTVVKTGKDGNCEQVDRFTTFAPEKTLKEIFKCIERIGPGNNPVFGVACGDPMDAKKGLILSPPNMPGWDRVEIVKELVERFGGEAYLMNDANAGAIAEWKFGAAKGFESVVFCTHGTGMGAGLILDNRLYEGTNGSAGEIGHIRLSADGPVGYGKKGSFEGLCSGGGIAQLARAKAAELKGKVAFNPGRIEDITTKDVALAAERGDTVAKEILALSGSYLGQGLSTIIDILNPQIIVLGSLFIRCRKFLEPAMKKRLEEETLSWSLANCKIVPAGLGEQIGNYAAVSVALYRKGIMN